MQDTTRSGCAPEPEGHGSAPRRLPFEGAVNFRDLGGYATDDGGSVRWRSLYRSDSLADLTPQDVAQLSQLGIRTICDFRIDAERREKPNRIPAGGGVREINIGFVPAGTMDMLAAIRAGTLTANGVREEVRRHYRRFPLDHTAEYASLFDALLAPGAFPFLMHCTSGKDRTGFGAAIVLLALGVPEDAVIEDYTLTNRYRRDIAHLLEPTVPEDVVTMLTSAQPEYMKEALAAISERWGCLDRYIEAGLGLSPARRDRLRALLVE